MSRSQQKHDKNCIINRIWPFYCLMYIRENEMAFTINTNQRWKLKRYIAAVAFGYNNGYLYGTRLPGDCFILIKTLAVQRRPFYYFLFLSYPLREIILCVHYHYNNYYFLIKAIRNSVCIKYYRRNQLKHNRPQCEDPL